MAGRRKTPRLRRDGKYYVVAVYRPDGRRTNISFGPAEERTEGQVLVAFGTWLDLFMKMPHKVLSYRSPYEAIAHILDPSKSITVKELLDRYLPHISENRSANGGRGLRLSYSIRRIRDFLAPYHSWPVADFGPDELLRVQDALINHVYTQGNRQKRYTRRGINDTIAIIRKVWRWGMGRQLVLHYSSIEG